MAHVKAGRLSFEPVDDHGELPGSEDSDTVLKDAFGNFEPPEEIDAGTPGKLNDSRRGIYNI